MVLLKKQVVYLYNPEPEGLSFKNDEVGCEVLFAMLPRTQGSSALTNIGASLFVHSCEFSTAQIRLSLRTTLEFRNGT